MSLPAFASRPSAIAEAEAEVAIEVGRYKVIAVSDGFIEMSEEYLGSPSHPTGGHEALRDEHGEAAMPIGCFLIPGDEPTLIDLGLGPHDRSEWEIALVGGRLPAALAKAGYAPEEIKVIALSHLHLDHAGWLCDTEAVPTFPNAKVFLGAEDWDYFIHGDPELPLDPPVREALLALAERDQVILLDDDRQIVPGLTRLAAPGHTPGHSLFVAHDGPERALLFGDAVQCPLQLTNEDWSVASDVDSALARRTRERFFRDMEENGGLGMGCHFPELRAGRVLGGDWVELP